MDDPMARREQTCCSGENEALLGGQKQCRPYFASIRASLGFTKLTVAVSVFTDDVLYGIVLPVLPSSLEDRVGLSASERQKWVSILLAVFGAAQVISTVLFGYLADRTGRKKSLYLSGLLALAIATTFLYIGDSLTILLIGRAAQGVSSAVICTVGISFIVDKAPVDQLGSALGIVGMSIATAIVVGPIIGGFAYRYAGYHTVFAISYVLLAIDILLSLLMIEDQGSTTNAETKDRDEYTPRNPHGSDSDNLCIFPELEEGSPDSRILTSRDSSPKSYKTRMYNCLPGIVWLLASPRILVCVAACFLNAALLTSFDSVIPLFTAETFNWNSDQQGLIFLTLCGGFFFEPLIGRLADRQGTRSVTTIGFLLSAPMFMALQLVNHDSAKQQALLCIFLVMIGFSLAIVHGPTMLEINLAVQAETSSKPELFGGRGAVGQANSLRSCAIAGGIAVGPLLSGFLRDQYGWKTMSMTLGCISAIAALVTFLWLGGRLEVQRKRVHPSPDCEE